MNLLGWFSIGLLWLAIIVNVWSIRRNLRRQRELDDMLKKYRKREIINAVMLHCDQTVKDAKCDVPWYIGRN